MSITGQNAPIQKLRQSKSNHSLYTENSQDSEVPTYRKQQQQINDLPKQIPVSHKINKLPALVPQQSPQKSQNIGKKQKPTETQEAMPSLPTRGANFRYADKTPQQNNVSRIYGAQFNTIAVAKFDKNEAGNMQGEGKNNMRYTGMSNNINQNERSRMMRSSQGGRWFRSQSLMQDNHKQQKVINNVDLMVRNFHKHQSKYVQQVQNYIKFYTMAKKQMQAKSSLLHKYKLNLGDTLEEIKNKMQIYLQSKIDLSNLPIDRPDANWGQQQLSKFYTTYNQILIRKIVNKDSQQDNSKTVTILKKYKNCTYYGPIKDGKKHGFGYLHYFSGRFFQGLFQNDQKIEGFQMDDSELYIGKYDKNQRHGEGILKTNEYLICGIFTNGQFKTELSSQPAFSSTGFGNQHAKNGENQLKAIRNGFKIQFSHITFYFQTQMIVQKSNSNDIYIGLLSEEGEKHGQGLQLFANGDLYVGKYEQGAPEGYGEYYWDSGAFYRGQFLSGMRHGKGIWRMIHGDRYDGQYLNDKKNGKGVYVWKSGDKYEGQFQNDYRHGYGEMHWHDGTSFKGQWLNGIQVNKTFKLKNQAIAQEKVKQIKQHGKTTSLSKNSFKSTQARTRVLKKEQIYKNNNKSLNTSKYAKLHAASQPSRNQPQQANKRIPLQKLKAMLSPLNSMN